MYFRENQTQIISDVFLGCYNVEELIAACIYELCRKI